MKTRTFGQHWHALALSSVFVSTLVSIVLVSTALTSTAIASPPTAKPASKQSSSTNASCPTFFGWSEGLVGYLTPTATLPTTQPLTDCDFQQWSWEAFTWATALDSSGAPRFLSLNTPDDLLVSGTVAKTSGPKVLRLGMRSKTAHGSLSGMEVTGAIVEADGNMLVAQNGYPVLASVHMNPSYFATAKNNLISNNGYQNNAGKDDYFSVGSAIFKATWLRLAQGETAPAGTYTTTAQVPVLTINQQTQQVVTSGQYVTATVALVGLHVVGTTTGHPEFLWATFEHNLNSPRVPDNTYDNFSSSPNNFTFYAANTPKINVNVQNQSPPTNASFNETTQRFTPVTNAVLENLTGGENQPNGASDVINVNAAAQTFLKNSTSVAPAQKVFANYDLIGTVWMQANTFVVTTSNWQNMNQANGIGSVNLANSTAETFVQVPTNAVQPANWSNCFLCHNPQTYAQFAPSGQQQLAPRRIGVSHVLAVGTAYAVPNLLPVCKDMNAGPIWNNVDAKTKCPIACGSTLQWNGQWTTTQPGQQSVCGCCGKN